MFEIVGWDNKEELVIVIYKKCIKKKEMYFRFKDTNRQK